MSIDDLAIDPVGVIGAIAEADDVELDRRQQLQPRLGQDARLQISRQRAGARDHRSQLFGAVGLQREPGLERAEAARQIGTEIAGPGRAGGKPARLAAQIGRRRGKGLRGAARRRAPAGSRRRRAPAPICGNRARSNRRARFRRAAAPAPATESRARQRRRRRETRVPARGTAQRSASRSSIAPISTVPAEPTTRNGFRPASRSRAIRSRSAATSMRCDRSTVDAAQRVAAEAGDVHRLGDAAMRRRRGIGRKLRAVVADAVLPHRRCPSAVVRATSTAIRLAIDVPVTKMPLAPCGKAEHLAHPFDDLPFDLDRHVIASAEIGVEPGRQHLRQHADRRAAAMHPAHEARMHVAGRIGHDEIGEFPVDLAEIGRRGAEASRETARGPHRGSAARPGARGCWRHSRSCRRACDDRARGSRPSCRDRASRSLRTAARPRAAPWSRRVLLRRRGAAIQHRGEGVENLAHLRRLVGKDLGRIHVVDDGGVVGLEDQQRRRRLVSAQSTVK